MKFRSTTGVDVQIGLTSGHTAVVTTEGNEIAAMFHKEAIARGCLPVGVASDGDTPVSSGNFDRAGVIARAIDGMLEGSGEGDFTADGKPDVRRLSGYCGFTVSREERDAAWAKHEQGEPQ